MQMVFARKAGAFSAMAHPNKIAGASMPALDRIGTSPWQ
jgi:hypothetical protein